MSTSSENERLPAFLGRGALTSLFIHVGILFPFATIAFLLAAREEAQKPDEVELSFEEVNPADLPQDLPPIDPEPTPKQAPKVKLAVREQPLPEKPPEQPPEQEPPPQQPAPRPEPKANQKSVDFHIDKEEEPAPDAKFLAEKNNRAEQETRAERTNLEREQRGETPSSSPSDRQDPEEGDPDDKVAKLQDQKSKQGRKAPDVTPHQQQSLSRSSTDDRKSMLSMRETAKRAHQISPETVDNALPRDPEGIIEMPDTQLQSMKDMPGRSGQSARTSLRLSSQQYEYVFGDDAEAAARFAQTEKSRKQGRFSKRMAQVKSALENFIPEVRPGNQTELNTRAAPFAAFIARMHRSIHEYWGFGFLEDLSSKSMSDPMNNKELVTRLEIVLAGDGTIDSVKVIQPSGLTSFDVAAVDVVYTAGPFPEPPAAIRSRNGKIYVHWSFHRDERQCATSHTDYYILDNPPAGGDQGPTALGGPQPAGSPGAQPLAPPSSGRASPGSPGSGPSRSLQRLERGMGDGENPSRPPPESDLQASRRVERERAQPDDPAALALADDWFRAFVRRDVKRMVENAMFPFKSRGGVAARSAGELSSMLQDLATETSRSARLGAVNVHSAAGARSILGGIPGSFGDGGGLLFAVGRIDSDTFVLVLARHEQRLARHRHRCGWSATRACERRCPGSSGAGCPGSSCPPRPCRCCRSGTGRRRGRSRRRGRWRRRPRP